MNTYLAVLKKYAEFRGRARRPEYWIFVLVNAIISGVLQLIARTTDSTFVDVISGLYGLAVLLPSLAVLVRRLHDTNRSGGWFFLVLIPLVGWIWLIVLLALPTTSGPNRYGPEPQTV